MELIKNYISKTNHRIGITTIVDSDFLKELKQNIVLAYEQKMEVVLNNDDIKHFKTTSNDAKQQIAQKLKDICKGLEIAYNGVVSRDGDGFVIDLRTIPSNTFEIKQR
jgi:hypothetical protein